jgi:hypothetical protein
MLWSTGMISSSRKWFLTLLFWHTIEIYWSGTVLYCTVHAYIRSFCLKSPSTNNMSCLWKATSHANIQKTSHMRTRHQMKEDISKWPTVVGSRRRVANVHRNIVSLVVLCLSVSEEGSRVNWNLKFIQESAPTAPTDCGERRVEKNAIHLSLVYCTVGYSFFVLHGFLVLKNSEENSRKSTPHAFKPTNTIFLIGATIIWSQNVKK